MPIIPLPKTSAPIADLPGVVLDRNKRPTVNNDEQGAAAVRLGSIKEPLINGNALAAPYEALIGVGRAIAQTGSVLGAMGAKQIQAQTDIQVAQADNEMQRVSGEFAAWKVENPNPDGWLEQWQKQLTGLKERVGGNDKLNGEARAQISQQLERFTTRSTMATQEDAAKETFHIAKSTFSAGLESDIEAQTPDAFQARMKTGAERGYFYPHELQRYEAKFKEVGEQKQKEAKAAESRSFKDAAVTFASGYGENQALEYIDEMTRGRPEAEREAYRATVREVSSVRRSDAMDTLSQGIISGRLGTPEEIDAEDDPHLTMALRDKAKKWLESRLDASKAQELQRDQEQNGERNFVELNRRIQEYDPAKDTDKSEGFRLRRETVERVGNEDSGYLREMLYAKMRAQPPKLEPRSEVTKMATDSLGALFDPETGSIPWKKKEVDETTGREKTVVDKNAQMKAIQAEAETLKKFNDWRRLNPQEANDPAKAQKRLLEILPEGERARQLDRLMQKSKPQASVTGKVTSYGYANDATPDANSRAGIGAFVPDEEAAKIKRGEPSDYRLRPDDLAVSPDVEAAFRRSGIKPGGDVLVKLQNGETRRVRWMDRTANDEQASKIGLPPLRGRFDLYSPTGKHPRDGMQVVGWEKISA